MKIAPVSRLKASLSQYLRRVKAGEDVIVTERGRPVAKLVPIEGISAAPHHLREMAREGRIKLGSGRVPKGFWSLRRPKDPQGLVLRALLQEREEGR